jgi:hypothetical protein
VYLLVPVVQLLPKNTFVYLFLAVFRVDSSADENVNNKVIDPFPSILQEFIKSKKKYCTKNKKIQILKKIHISKYQGVTIRPVAMRPVTIRLVTINSTKHGNRTVVIRTVGVRTVTFNTSSDQSKSEESQNSQNQNSHNKRKNKQG